MSSFPEILPLRYSDSNIPCQQVKYCIWGCWENCNIQISCELACDACFLLDPFPGPTAVQMEEKMEDRVASEEKSSGLPCCRPSKGFWPAWQYRCLTERGTRHVKDKYEMSEACYSSFGTVFREHFIFASLVFSWLLTYIMNSEDFYNNSWGTKHLLRRYLQEAAFPAVNEWRTANTLQFSQQAKAESTTALSPLPLIFQSQLHCSLSWQSQGAPGPLPSVLTGLVCLCYCHTSALHLFCDTELLEGILPLPT